MQQGGTKMSTKDDISDDLAYVKALAEEGRDTPLVGGVMYVIWGCLIGTAALLVYAHAMSWISLGSMAGYAPWITASAIGWVLSVFLGRRANRKPGAATLGNKTATAVWCSVGIFITGFWIVLMVVHDNFQADGIPPYFLFGLMFPMFFGLYGVALYATATAARATWLRWFAALSWIMSALSMVLMASPHQMLVAVIGCFIGVAGPGLILMRNEPSEIV